MPRREAIRWMLAAAASVSALDHPAFGVRPKIIGSPEGTPGGYGTDPNLMKIYAPGDCWPLTFTDTQRKTAAAWCDVIIPEDDKSPSASKVGVVDFIDEWISSPYPQQQPDRKIVLDGLAWIEAESQKRFEKDFASLNEEQKHAICDDICYPPKAKKEFKEAAKFFSRFRSLTASGFYSTPVGMADIGYVGNTPLAKFDGPPQEVLDRLGVTQTVT
jgi:hypothetical protein